MDIVVFGKTTGPQAQVMINGQTFAAAIGRNGLIAVADKREGDGKTPLGRFQLLYGMYSASGRVPSDFCRNSNLKWEAITSSSGWCDAPENPLYNQRCPAGYAASHELLHRSDTAYDLLLVTDHNTPPRLASDGGAMGSAVFLHVWDPAKEHTAGCVALRFADLVAVLKLRPTHIDIRLAE